ncbi:MAG: hypothetical protein ABFE01_10850 [Phycisphaerales bacterium]|jgi:hypothetical protein
MIDLNRYRLKIQYHGLEGYSEIGFKKRKAVLDDLFPAADELILSMKAYFLKLGQAAAIIYEVPDLSFDVVESDRILELAVPNPHGESMGVVIDVLAADIQNARMMLNDIETTCGFVRAKLRDALQVMEMSEDDYVQRLKDSMNLMANELHRKAEPGP